jgi:hypothetical protein
MKNRYKPDPAGVAVEELTIYETLVKRPINVEAISNELRLKVYEYLHEASDMSTEWLIETMQLWDRVTGAKSEFNREEAQNDNLRCVDEDFVLACALVADKLRKHVPDPSFPQVDDPFACLEQRDDEVTVVKVRALSQAIGEAEQQQQWQRIKLWEQHIWTRERALIALSAATDGSGNRNGTSICLWDYAVELSDELHAFANPKDVAVAAETQLFRGWESTEIGNETMTAHCFVTSMLIELAFMNLLHDAYAISSAAVAAIAASIALEQFPWHATVPLFQGYLLHITNRFIANDHEARLCKVFEERLRDLWRRPPSSCVVMKRWVFRAERNQLLAMVMPPAVKGATTPMTPSSGKRCNKKTSVALAPPGADKASPPKKKKYYYYAPVAKKKSGGARANSGRKKAMSRDRE